MTLYEIILIIAMIIILTIPYFVKQPMSTYLKLFAYIFLLILIWFTIPESSLLTKALMTAVVFFGATRTLKDYVTEKKIKNKSFKK